MVRSLASLLAAALTAAVLAASASAAPEYTLENCFSASGTSGCATGTPLGNAASAVPSPDGHFVYGEAVGIPPGVGGVTVYTRSAAHGTLTRVTGATGCYDLNGSGGCTTESGLSQPFDLAFDPSDPTGAYGYVLGFGDTATLDVLARNPSTGAFTAQANCLSDTGGCTPPDPGTTTLTLARSEVFSPDGQNLYVASSGRGSSGNGDGITRFSMASPVPVFQGCTSESGAGDCVQRDGLTGGTDQMAISADGKFLYTTGLTDNTVLAIPRNTTTGALTPGGALCYTSDISLGCTGSISDLAQPYAVLIPPTDQSHLYVGTGSGVSVFSRNASTGALSHVQCLNATGSGGCQAANGLGISVVNHLALTPDGTDLAVTEAGTNGGIVFLKRDPTTGLLSQLPGRAGCVTADGTSASCRVLTALGGVSLVHSAPDASQFYLGATANGTLAGFRSDNPPVCANGSASTAFQTAVSVPLSCSDPDGDPVSIQVVGAPAHGGLGAISGAAGTYNPFAGFSGADAFTFQAVAHSLTSAPASDTVSVGAAPIPPTPRITSAIGERWLAGTTTKVERLTIEDIPKGATVTITCKPEKHAKHKGGCPFSKKTYHEPNGKSALALKSKFKHHLDPGVELTVAITAPGSIGKKVEFTIRKRHLPKTKTLCFPVGSTHAHSHC